MKISNNIIQKYNQKDTLLVISTYPKKGEIYSRHVDAVAPYTKKTILGMKKNNPSQKIVVLAPVLHANDSYTSYTDNGVFVIRCFKRNDEFSFQNLLNQVKAFTQISSILVEFEFSSYGDMKSTLALPVLLTMLTFLQKKVTLVLHQVVLDLGTLSGHIGVKGWMTKIMSLALRHYYKLLCAPVQSVIVLEDEIKKRLSQLVDSRKIHVSYHGVDDDSLVKPLQQKKAKKFLGIKNDEFVILYFGYITWYKGADFLAKVFQKDKQLNGKKVRVILAGGHSATQNHKRHYQNFFKRVEALVDNNKQLTLTGFVKEQDLATYMSAADLVVYPYRTFMSSSGALALTFAFEKPFIVSSKLRAYFTSHDIATLLAKAGMTFEDISFALQEKDFWKTVQKVSTVKAMKKIAALSTSIKRQRDFSKMSKQYAAILADEKNFTFSLPQLQLSYGEK